MVKFGLQRHLSAKTQFLPELKQLNLWSSKFPRNTVKTDAHHPNNSVNIGLCLHIEAVTTFGLFWEWKLDWNMHYTQNIRLIKQTLIFMLFKLCVLKTNKNTKQKLSALSYAACQISVKRCQASTIKILSSSERTITSLQVQLMNLLSSCLSYHPDLCLLQHRQPLNGWTTRNFRGLHDKLGWNRKRTKVAKHVRSC
jgi:hypothetical protein